MRLAGFKCGLTRRVRLTWGSADLIGVNNFAGSSALQDAGETILIARERTLLIETRPSLPSAD